MAMVVQSNEYSKKYIDIINNIRYRLDDESNNALRKNMREDYGKLGLFSSAADFLGLMHDIRKSANTQEIAWLVSIMAMKTLLVVSWITGKSAEDIVSSQIELFKVKNKRYGNAFSECYTKDGNHYAFGHLQEKINRICSLLMLNDEAKEEPILDSYKDLLGYCILTLIELE